MTAINHEIETQQISFQKLNLKEDIINRLIAKAEESAKIENSYIFHYFLAE